MVRISKQGERRHQSPRRPRKPSEKTGSQRDQLPQGFKEHANALAGEAGTKAFIPKIK